MENFVTYVRNLKKQTATTEQTIAYPKGRKYPDVPNKDQVSDWEIYFYEALYDAGIKKIPQYPADKYKLDLAIILGDKNWILKLMERCIIKPGMENYVIEIN